MSKTVKIVRVALLVLLCVLLAVLAIYAVLYVPKIGTMASVRAVTDFDPYNVYEMDYTADYQLDRILAAGADSTQAFTDLSLSVLLPGIPVHVDTVEPGCSACLVKNAEGTPLFGRNFDLDDTSAMVIRTHPENGYASIGLANLRYLGIDDAGGIVGRVASLLLPYTTMDGVNEKGLACTILRLDDVPTRQNTGKTPITTTVAVRLILDRAATVNEAISLLRRYDMCSVSGGDYHFFVADAKGNSAVISWPEPKDEMVVTRNVNVVANHFVCGVPEGVNPGHGQERTAAMRAYLDEHGPVLDVSGVREMLRSAAQTVKTDLSGVTQWSAVYDLAAREVHVVFRREWDTVYSFSLFPDSGS